MKVPSLKKMGAKGEANFSHPSVFMTRMSPPSNARMLTSEQSGYDDSPLDLFGDDENERPPPEVVAFNSDDEQLDSGTESNQPLTKRKTLSRATAQEVELPTSQATPAPPQKPQGTSRIACATSQTTAISPHSVPLTFSSGAGSSNHTETFVVEAGSEGFDDLFDDLFDDVVPPPKHYQQISPDALIDRSAFLGHDNSPCFPESSNIQSGHAALSAGASREIVKNGQSQAVSQVGDVVHTETGNILDSNWLDEEIEKRRVQDIMAPCPETQLYSGFSQQENVREPLAQTGHYGQLPRHQPPQRSDFQRSYSHQPPHQQTLSQPVYSRQIPQLAAHQSPHISGFKCSDSHQPSCQQVSLQPAYSRQVPQSATRQSSSVQEKAPQLIAEDNNAEALRDFTYTSSILISMLASIAGPGMQARITSCVKELEMSSSLEEIPPGMRVTFDTMKGYLIGNPPFLKAAIAYIMELPEETDEQIFGEYRTDPKHRKDISHMSPSVLRKEYKAMEGRLVTATKKWKEYKSKSQAAEKKLHEWDKAAAIYCPACHEMAAPYARPPTVITGTASTSPQSSSLSSIIATPRNNEPCFYTSPYQSTDGDFARQRASNQGFSNPMTHEQPSRYSGSQQLPQGSQGSLGTDPLASSLDDFPSHREHCLPRVDVSQKYYSQSSSINSRYPSAPPSVPIPSLGRGKPSMGPDSGVLTASLSSPQLSQSSSLLPSSLQTSIPGTSQPSPQSTIAGDNGSGPKFRKRKQDHAADIRESVLPSKRRAISEGRGERVLKSTPMTRSISDPEVTKANATGAQFAGGRKYDWYPRGHYIPPVKFTTASSKTKIIDLTASNENEEGETEEGDGSTDKGPVRDSLANEKPVDAFDEDAFAEELTAELGNQ